MAMYHNSSLSFYQKQKALADVSLRAQLGFEDFQRHQKILKPRTIDLFKKFSSLNREGQKELLDDDGDAYIQAFFEIVKTLNSHRELMEYLLPTIDAILIQEPKILRQFINEIKGKKNHPLLTTLRSILQVEDHYPASYEAAVRIVCIILGELPVSSYCQEQQNFILDLINMRKEKRKQRISNFGLLSSIIHLIKHEVHVELFLRNGGDEFILTCFGHKNDNQVVYYTLLNTWLLSFSQYAIDNFFSVPKYGILRIICDILQKLSRQKLIRVSFNIFKNIQQNKLCLQLLIDAKILKTIDTLLKRTIKDEQLIETIKNFTTVMEQNMKILSSFEKYARQIESGKLDWSSVHNQRFWRENALKFQYNEFHLVKKLKSLLSSKDPVNCAVACFDIGEFCRFYPRGRTIVETLGLKNLIMDLARYSQDKKVREEALLALQKILIQNWQSI